jgi:hypothetical protein
VRRPWPPFVSCGLGPVRFLCVSFAERGTFFVWDKTHRTRHAARLRAAERQPVRFRTPRQRQPVGEIRSDKRIIKVFLAQWWLRWSIACTCTKIWAREMSMGTTVRPRATTTQQVQGKGTSEGGTSEAHRPQFSQRAAASAHPKAGPGHSPRHTGGFDVYPQNT